MGGGQPTRKGQASKAAFCCSIRVATKLDGVWGSQALAVLVTARPCMRGLRCVPTLTCPTRWPLSFCEKLVCVAAALWHKEGTAPVAPPARECADEIKGQA